MFRAAIHTYPPTPQFVLVHIHLWVTTHSSIRLKSPLPDCAFDINPLFSHAMKTQKCTSLSTQTLWGYIGQRGISLSGSYQQGYSTTYNTRLHIKVVCNGYILTHISNCNPRGHQGAIPPQGDAPSYMTQGQGPICMHVRCTRVNITAFWHGF